MPLILPGNVGSATAGAYSVSNSLRGDRASSNYLSKTLGTGDRDKWTWSAWLKKNSNGNVIALFASYPDGNNFSVFNFTDEDTLQYHDKAAGSTQAKLVTNRKFRDVSAWYHIVLVYDSGNATSGNRIRLYINGQEETDFSTDTMPGQNNDSTINRSGAHYLGTDDTTGYYLDCYLAEVRFVDGSALTPTDFGEFDSDSPLIWKPKAVSGLTNGTNGFYLEFKQSGTSANSSGLGADTSGNTHHFAVTNLTALDQSTDTCTNNFATMNPLNVPTSNAPTFAEGNLKTTSGTTGGAYMGSATIGVSSGKWYAEMKVKVIDSMIAGVSANVAEDARDSTYPGQQGNSAGILPDTGNKYINDSGSTHGDAFSANDVLMIALDLDNNNVYFGRNGNWFDGSGNADESSPNSAISLTAAASTTDGFYFFSVGDGGGSAAAAAEWNFGSPMYTISSGNADGNGYGNFEYAVPSGYYALNTKNLAEYG
jgi:hypothetical protein